MSRINLEQAQQEISTFISEDSKGLMALEDGRKSDRAPFRAIRNREGRCIGKSRLSNHLYAIL